MAGARPGFPLAGRPWRNPEHSLGVLQHHRGLSVLLSLNTVWKNNVLETIERGRAAFDLHTKNYAPPTKPGGIRPGPPGRTLNRFHRRFEPRRRTRQAGRATPGISLQPLAPGFALRGGLKT